MGKIICTGLGPGDPDLMSLRADRAIRAAAHVAYFRKAGRAGQARRIVEGMLAPGVTEYPMEYPVTTELHFDSPEYIRILAAFYDDWAARLKTLAQSQDVVVLCEGDPFFYGSFMHLYTRLKDVVPIEVIPGITGMSGCWTATGQPITWGDEVLTVLVDYFGHEVTDGLAVCHRFADLAQSGRMQLRLDTHGGRFLEGLDPAESYAVLERHAPGAIRRYRSETELRYLIGTGVSAAAIWRMREALDAAGFPKVRIVVSSGFGVDKCRVMADAKAPIDVIGTGSFIPDTWAETYATADIVEYDGTPMVKVGREFLLRRNGARKAAAG